MSSSLYVIAAWCGGRRYEDPRRGSDPWFYVRKHVEALEAIRFPHEVLVMVSGEKAPEEPFSSKINLSYEKRKNQGMSYGAWSEAFDRYPGYDHYAIAEDDYVPLVDPLRVLVPLAVQEGIDYLGGLVFENPTHMAISNGIINQGAFIRAAAVRVPGGLGPEDDAYGYAVDAQINFSQDFIRSCSRVAAYTPWYKTPYFDGEKNVTFGDPEHAAIWVPVQMVK